MSREQRGKAMELSRRAFLAATGGTLAGAAAFGLSGEAKAGEPKPGRGGALRIATRSDSIGLDLRDRRRGQPVAVSGSL
jgi:hypothetical protein